MTQELQLKGISEADIDDNDILLGRGGKTNHHPGNASYLKLIEVRQVEYMFLESRTEKTEYAMNFVQKLRKEGIRFLKKDDKEGKHWSDVGDVKMREKVSQNLREHQPKLKKQLAAQQQAQQKVQQQQPMGMNNMTQLSPQTSGNNVIMSMPQLNQQNSVVGGMGNNMVTMPQLSQQSSGGSHNNNMMGMHNNGMSMNNNMNNMNNNNVMSMNNNMNNNNLSPMSQRQFVDPQQLMQQQQFLQMQAMAQQSQMQTQQQFQLLQQQQGMMGNNSLNNNFGNQMMNGMGGSMGNMNNMAMQPVMSMGGMDMGNNNNMNNIGGGVDPLPFNNMPGRAQWSSSDERERGLLDNFNTQNHPLGGISGGAMPENIGSSMQQPQNNNFVNHDINDGDTPLKNHNIAKPSLGNRVATLTDVDVAVAMGESTHSLLDSLHIEQVPEEREGDAEQSPQPNMNVIGNLDQMTPVLNNKQKLAPPFLGGSGRSNNKNPATVTPTTNSPKQNPKGSNVCVLDNDILNAWANTDDDDDSFANAIGGDDDAGAGDFSSQRKAGFNDPFRSTSPMPLGAKAASAPASARPGVLTKDKRATSNVNETPETRGHLKFQEMPLNDVMTSSFSSTAGYGSNFSSSSFSSVKKASLGRDKSEQSRLLKQQCMPNFSFSSNPANSSGNTPGGGGWPTNLPLDNNTLSPIPDGGKQAANSEVTPKTARVLQDFGKMTLSMAQQNGLSPLPEKPTTTTARTAGRFEETFGTLDTAAVHQMPMDLMVKKPSALMWRNRSSTIEALDLDSLEDDNVLKEERNIGAGDNPGERTSINSIAGMWASMPTSEEFDALVSDIAGQKVTDLGVGVEQQPKMGKTVSKQPRTHPSLALPNLKAS